MNGHVLNRMGTSWLLELGEKGKDNLGCHFILQLLLVLFSLRMCAQNQIPLNCFKSSPFSIIKFAKNVSHLLSNNHGVFL
jgi:hypothetical protein